MPWKHVSGDGLEEALQHEQEESCYVPMQQIRNNNDVIQWLSNIEPKRFVTKSDIVELAIHLFRHVANLQKRKDVEREQRLSEEHTWKHKTITSIVTGASRTVSERASSGAQGTIVKFGTAWGRWSYQNDAHLGRCIRHSSGYLIDFARASTPEELGEWISHLSAKEHTFSPDDLGDATAALIACFIDGELPGNEGLQEASDCD